MIYTSIKSSVNCRILPRHGLLQGSFRFFLPWQFVAVRIAPLCFWDKTLWSSVHSLQAQCIVHTNAWDLDSSKLETQHRVGDPLKENKGTVIHKLLSLMVIMSAIKTVQSIFCMHLNTIPLLISVFWLHIFYADSMQLQFNNQDIIK